MDQSVLATPLINICPPVKCGKSLSGQEGTKPPLGLATRALPLVATENIQLKCSWTPVQPFSSQCAAPEETTSSKKQAPAEEVHQQPTGQSVGVTPLINPCPPTKCGNSLPGQEGTEPPLGLATRALPLVATEPIQL